MQIEPFALERFFAEHEFAVRHNLAASDVEGMALRELLALADAETSALWDRLTLGYTESAGHPLLRQEIAALDHLSPDDILVCAGAEEALFVTLHALLRPGDHAVVVWPAYQSLHELARAAGASVTLVELQAARGWRLDLAEVQAAIRANTRAVVINFPHNPTGAHISTAELAGLVAICEARGITLVSDEVYRFLEHDPADQLPAAATLGEHAVSIGVMSKSFALAGLRIGWLATRDRKLQERAAELKDYTTICNAAPSEILALIALRAREAVLARSRAIVADNLGRVRELFARYAEVIEWIEPRAGSVAFPRLRGAEAAAWTSLLIEREGILLIPGTEFGGWTEHFRIGFGRRDTAAALDGLERFIRHSLCDSPVEAAKLT